MHPILKGDNTYFLTAGGWAIKGKKQQFVGMRQNYTVKRGFFEN